jgi:AcrR family transcriptional regulator
MEDENQRVRLTKMLLKEELSRLLTEKPINRVTVKELCAGAGINRSTFYQHYPDQYALLEDIETDIILRTDEFISRINPEKSGRQYLVELMAYIRKNETILSVLLNSQPGTNFQARFMGTVLKKLGAVQPGLFRSELMPYFSQFLVSGNISLIQQWIKTGMELTDERMADMLYGLSEGVVKAFESIK